MRLFEAFLGEPARRRSAKSVHSHPQDAQKARQRFQTRPGFAKTAISNQNQKHVKKTIGFALFLAPRPRKKRLRSNQRGTDAYWKRVSASTMHQEALCEALKTSLRGHRSAHSSKNHSEAGGGRERRGQAPVAKTPSPSLFPICEYPLPSGGRIGRIGRK